MFLSTIIDKDVITLYVTGFVKNTNLHHIYPIYIVLRKKLMCV